MAAQPPPGGYRVPRARLEEWAREDAGAREALKLMDERDALALSVLDYRETLERIGPLDKTREYEYSGPHSLNDRGQNPPPGKRWLRPREAALDCLNRNPESPRVQEAQAMRAVVEALQASGMDHNWNCASRPAVDGPCNCGAPKVFAALYALKTLQARL
jgi:hypothetical protein